jgi:putative pyrimidine permease RutG
MLGTGDFTLKLGEFTLGGIGTATFGAIILNAVLSGHSRGDRQSAEAKDTAAES